MAAFLEFARDIRSIGADESDTRLTGALLAFQSVRTRWRSGFNSEKAAGSAFIAIPLRAHLGHLCHSH